MRRTVVVKNPTHIRVASRCLRFEQPDGTTSLPPEEVGVLVLESPRATVTAPALAALAASGAAVVVCDGRRMPVALCAPMGVHREGSLVLGLQTGAGKPLIKQLWRRIVTAKIENQAAVLRLRGLPDAALAKMASGVRSGDAGGMEAAAAGAYFRLLIPSGTRRDSAYTPFLDYGYSVLRAAMARELASHGFCAALGIHHRGSRNPRNLADDLMEPYRPFVDLAAFSCDPLSFDGAARLRLAAVLEEPAAVEGRREPVQFAIEETVESLRRALEKGDAGCLLLPSIPRRDGS